MPVFGWIWAVLTSPFRLVGWLVAMTGRLVALLVGFGLMVAGVALVAGSHYAFGIPLFLVGLILTLRSLG